MHTYLANVAHPSHRPLVVPMTWVGGGLRALLSSHLLPEAVSNVQFVCGPDDVGALTVEVFTGEAGRPAVNNILHPRLQAPFARCFLRFWSRVVIEWPEADAPPETWEWFSGVEGLMCRTRSPDVRVSRVRGGRVRVRHPLRVVTRRERPQPYRHESSA